MKRLSAHEPNGRATEQRGPFVAERAARAQGRGTLDELGPEVPRRACVPPRS